MPDVVEPVELFVTSAFSFLRGASTPEALVERAVAQGHQRLAITDRNGLYGVVRAYRAAKEQARETEAPPLQILAGAEIVTDAEGERPALVLLASDRKSYGRLSRLLSEGKLRTGKGGLQLDFDDIAKAAEGLFALHVGAPDPFLLQREKEVFGERLSLAIFRTLTPFDASDLEAARSASRRFEVPLVATGAVLMHDAAQKPLLDILWCIRLGLLLDRAGRRLAPNSARVLRSPSELRALFDEFPEALARSRAIADAVSFRLDQLEHEFALELVPQGTTPMSYLRGLVQQGACERYPDGVPADVERQLGHELEIIETLGYEGYFLTVWDIVRWARSRRILCQGRGSAANSIVCYVLGITSIDPVRMNLLFERFVSVERGEPPDIDVDFEHERREEVMQYVYQKYGRDHAALVATVIMYRSRSAFREVGKVFGLSTDQLDRLSGLSHDLAIGEEEEGDARNWVWNKRQKVTLDELVRAGLDPKDRRVEQTIHWARRLTGLPRHLGQHSGGFVISRAPLSEITTLENATMEQRTVIAWDKDDIEALGFFKIDLLALGMLTAVRRTFDLVRTFERIDLDLASIPAEDPRVYAMICDADTIGTFQVESRAQMQILPKLLPKTFYDLVVSVAIIRPGPIQGDMVHPYLRRRRGEEPVELPHPALADILGKTYGVPLFQEQVMKMAVAVAGFSGGEADELRRAIGWRSKIHIDRLRKRMIDGMLARGIDLEYAERIFHMMQGFGGYGFPESHSASFALIAYASCYLKRYHPAAFLAALLNSQPMGFYSPNSLVKDGERHGLEVRPVSVVHSAWEARLEGPDARVQAEWWRTQPEISSRMRHTPWQDGLTGRGLPVQPAIRLGLQQVRGLAKAEGERIEAARQKYAFSSIADVVARAALPKDKARTLATAGAFEDLEPSRRGALWRTLTYDDSALFAGVELPAAAPVPLAEMSPAERLSADYEATGLSVELHPMALLREIVRSQGIIGYREHLTVGSGRRVKVGGLVVTRQRPGTASGVVFITLEDEDGHMNLVVFPKIYERDRRICVESHLLVAEGRIEHEHGVTNVIVDRFARMPGASAEPKGRYTQFYRCS